MNDEQRPTWAQQLVESKVAAVIGRRLAEKQKRVAKSGAAEPASGPVTRRIPAPVPPAPATRSAAPEQPHFHVEPEHGKLVAVTVNGVEHWGKVTDWNEQTGGVRVATRAGVVNAKRHHLRPVSDDELARHYEREDADQEQRGVQTSRYGTDDIVRGWRVTCVDPATDEATEGTVVSVAHDHPQHVVVRTHEHGKPKLTVHPHHHVVSIEEPGR